MQLERLFKAILYTVWLPIRLAERLENAQWLVHGRGSHPSLCIVKFGDILGGHGSAVNPRGWVPTSPNIPRFT